MKHLMITAFAILISSGSAFGQSATTPDSVCASLNNAYFDVQGAIVQIDSIKNDPSGKLVDIQQNLRASVAAFIVRSAFYVKCPDPSKITNPPTAVAFDVSLMSEDSISGLFHVCPLHATALTLAISAQEALHAARNTGTFFDGELQSALSNLNSQVGFMKQAVAKTKDCANAQPYNENDLK
jgi:hypothetical protein